MEETRERVTITLPRQLLASVDGMVDGERIRNRSHAVETLLSKAMGGSPVDTALVLAGGACPGDPEGSCTPHAMAEINGKPLAHHTVEWLRSNGIRNIIFAVSAKNHDVESYFKDGSSFGASISYSREEKPLGTAGSIYRARKRLKSTFLVVYGDIFTAFSLKGLIEFHRARKAEMTVALKSVSDPSHYGAAELEGNWVVGFAEKPSAKDAKSHMVSAGVYAFEPSLLARLSEPLSLEREVIPELAAMHKAAGYPISGPWLDIGKPGSLEAAKAVSKR